jgi:hypothetical protein
MSVEAVSPRLAAGFERILPREWRRWTATPHSTRWFWLLWSFIGVVSLFDAWLVLVNQSEMLFVEENLLCYLLIKLDPHGLSYFLPAKAAGTVLVLAILRAIYARLRQHGMVITGGVAMYQFLLLCYFLL